MIPKMQKLFVRVFVEHPAKVKENYFQHMMFAMKTGMLLMGLGVICIIHGIFPHLFETTMSENLAKIAMKLQERNSR